MGSGRAEVARAQMIELFPQGFEEVATGDGVELVAYTDAGGEERLWHVFGGGQGAEVPDGWETAWRRFHRPVKVGELWVGPPWEPPPEGVTAVVIEPGRAFGTGSHPTTRLCLELLQTVERGSLLDVGCGSGVLAVAAAKLGFEPVFAVDLEPEAAEATARNAEANGVAVRVLTADARIDALPEVELAVANITLADVQGVVPHLAVRRAITSGYLADEQPRLTGLTHCERRLEGGWAADLFAR